MNLDATDDNAFTILAHPVRRRILQEMFEFKEVTYSLLSNDWKLKSGTIYHHLKILDPYILHKPNSAYRLNDAGIKICELFLRSSKGKLTVEKVDALIRFPFPIVRFVENNARIILPMVIGILLSAYVLSYRVGIVILGPLLLPTPDIIDPKFVVYVNVGSTLLFVLTLLGTWSVLFSKGNGSNWNLIIMLLVALAPSSIILIGFYWVNYFTVFLVPLNLWILISLFSQLLFLFLVSSSLVVNYGVSVEKSIMFTLLNLWALFIGALILITS